MVTSSHEAGEYCSLDQPWRDPVPSVIPYRSAQCLKAHSAGHVDDGLADYAKKGLALGGKQCHAGTSWMTPNVYWTRSPCGPILKNGSACSLIGKPGGWFHRSNRRRGFQVAGEAAPLPGTTTFPAPSGLEFPEGSAISTSSPAGVSIYPAKRGALLWTRWEAGGPRTVAFTASPTKPPDHERRDVGEGGGDLARQTGAPPPCGASRAVRSSGDTPY